MWRTMLDEEASGRVDELESDGDRAVEQGSRVVLNVSTGQLTTVNDLVRILGEMDGGVVPTVYAPLRPGDIRDSCLDNRRAVEILGWEPQCSLERGLTETLVCCRSLQHG